MTYKGPELGTYLARSSERKNCQSGWSKAGKSEVRRSSSQNLEFSNSISVETGSLWNEWYFRMLSLATLKGKWEVRGLREVCKAYIRKSKIGKELAIFMDLKGDQLGVETIHKGAQNEVRKVGRGPLW